MKITKVLYSFLGVVAVASAATDVTVETEAVAATTSLDLTDNVSMVGVSRDSVIFRLHNSLCLESHRWLNPLCLQTCNDDSWYILILSWYNRFIHSTPQEEVSLLLFFLPPLVDPLFHLLHCCICHSSIVIKSITSLKVITNNKWLYQYSWSLRLLTLMPTQLTSGAFKEAFIFHILYNWMRVFGRRWTTQAIISISTLKGSKIASINDIYVMVLIHVLFCGYHNQYFAVEVVIAFPSH